MVYIGLMHFLSVSLLMFYLLHAADAARAQQLMFYVLLILRVSG